jgi:hypothetical protein
VINPPGIAPLVPAYSVALRDGEFIYVSGMTGVVPGTQDHHCRRRCSTDAPTLGKHSRGDSDRRVLRCLTWTSAPSSCAIWVITLRPINKSQNGGIMQGQLITYQLQDISQAEYLKQMVEPDAPVLAKVPGLISKVWLADEEKNTFGGFYLWESKTAMEDFMHSDLVKAVVSRPFVKNVSSVDFEVNQNASLITRGLK